MPEVYNNELEKLVTEIASLYTDLVKLSEAGVSEINPLALETRFSLLLDSLNADVQTGFQERVKAVIPKALTNPEYLQPAIAFLQTLPTLLSSTPTTFADPEKIKVLVQDLEQSRQIQQQADLSGQRWQNLWQKQLAQHNRQQIYQAAQDAAPDQPAQFYTQAANDVFNFAKDEVKKVKADPTQKSGARTRVEDMARGVLAGQTSPAMQRFVDLAIAAAIVEEENVRLSQEATYLQAKLDAESIRQQHQAELNNLQTTTNVSGLTNYETLISEAILDQHKTELFGTAQNIEILNNRLQQYGFSISPNLYSIVSAQAQDVFIKSQTQISGKFPFDKQGPPGTPGGVAVGKILGGPVQGRAQDLSSFLSIRIRRLWDRMMLGFQGLRLPGFFGGAQNVITSPPISNALSGTINSAAQGLLSLPSRLSQASGLARGLGGAAAQTAKSLWWKNPWVWGTIIILVLIFGTAFGLPTPGSIPQSIKTQIAALVPPALPGGPGLGAGALDTIYKGPLTQSQITGCPTDPGLRICQVPYTGENYSHNTVNAYDIAAAYGAPVFATHNGFVVSYSIKFGVKEKDCTSGGMSVYGNYVILKHTENDAPNGNVIEYTWYGHFKDVTQQVIDSKDNNVLISAGSMLGTADDNGCSTGNHLHYEHRDASNQPDHAQFLDTNKCNYSTGC